MEKFFKVCYFECWLEYFQVMVNIYFEGLKVEEVK